MSVRSLLVRLVRMLHLEPVLRPTYIRGLEFRRKLSSTSTGTARTLRWGLSPARRQLARGFRRILAARVTFDEVVGIPAATSLAIVVCLWNRPGRIEDILKLADKQATETPIRLVLWNNNIADAEHYLQSVRSFAPSGSLSSVELHNSVVNIGGIGRFVAIRELVRRGYHGAFVMVDDDQDVTSEFVDSLLAVAEPRVIGSVWAWITDGKYWNRRAVDSTGSAANHAGTGGAVCDSDIVTHPEFFTRLPLRFLFMEDIWMSQVALRNGWRIVKVDTPVSFVLADLDQGHAIYDRKEDFYTWLRRPRSIPHWVD